MMQLRFNEYGSFKVLQFTDIHFTDDNDVDARTTDLMRRLIAEEKPDFIMTTGDTVFGPDNGKNLGKALAPLVESGIPWSYVFGNHDTEEGIAYEELFPMVTGLAGCMAFHDESSGKGMGNHWLEVVDSMGVVKWVLFAVDSGSYNELDMVDGYGFVGRDQMDWYGDKIGELELRENKEFGVLTFFHIALPEFHELWCRQVCYGEKREEICSPRVNSGFFTAMLEAGHTRGVFVGHDHVNDFMGNLYGITLGYGRATGYNTYGHEGFERGTRVFVLDEKNTTEFDTYLRLADGCVIRNQVKHEPEGIWEVESGE